MTTRRGFLAGLLATAAAPALARAMPPQRGMAYVVFENCDLSMWGPGARVPSMEFEVQVGPNGIITLPFAPPRGATITAALDFDATVASFNTRRLFEGDGKVTRIWADHRLLYDRDAPI